MANKALLRKTLSQIKKNPKHWDQNLWHCGTSYCFGGWAVKLDGGRFVKDSGFYVLARADDPIEDIEEDDINGRIFKVILISTRAERILRLSKTQASRLFHPNNTLKRVIIEVKRLSNA